MSTSTPVITELRVIPVAGRDSMLLNLSGAHGPFFTRNLLILTDSAGRTGVLAQVLLQERVRVEVDRGHLDLAVDPAPRGAVAVPVELDAVALGIGEVERLAHQVV